MNLVHWCALGTVLFLTLGACGDDGDGDDDDGSGGSSSSTSSSSTSGTGGSASCMSCGDFIMACITECPPGEPQEIVCAGSSWDMVNALNGCICGASEGNCEADCPARCTDTGEDGDNCLGCQGAAVGGVCKDAFDACMADM
ncbi:MAG: hypothetical protein JRI68_25600 [Deltaproteobacteria bacterium]|nr:hypothetical protein [Deltaproteobacteria bacterium]